MSHVKSATAQFGIAAHVDYVLEHLIAHQGELLMYGRAADQAHLTQDVFQRTVAHIRNRILPHDVRGLPSGCRVVSYQSKSARSKNRCVTIGIALVTPGMETVEVRSQEGVLTEVIGIPTLGNRITVENARLMMQSAVMAEVVKERRQPLTSLPRIVETEYFTIERQPRQMDSYIFDPAEPGRRIRLSRDETTLLEHLWIHRAERVRVSASDLQKALKSDTTVPSPFEVNRLARNVSEKLGQLFPTWGAYILSLPGITQGYKFETVSPLLRRDEKTAGRGVGTDARSACSLV